MEVIDRIAQSSARTNCKYYEYKNFSNIKEISSGRSFETIYRANLKTSFKSYVLKSFSSHSDDMIKAIIHELTLHRKVDFHENIILFHGITFTDKEHYLVMEYADSGTLRDYLKERFHILTWKDKFNLALRLACAVAYLHDERIVHNDLSSSSILVHRDTIKLKDLGLSKRIERESKTKSKLKRLYGTIPYVDPKIFSRKNSINLTQVYSFNKMSDVYSVGVILWEISSGQPPFSPYYSEEYDMDLALEILRGVRETIIPNTPERYSNIYIECWNGEPENRPNIHQVVADLKDIIAQETRDIEATNYLRLFLNVNEHTAIVDNKFGRGIEFRRGAPIQLLKCNETDDENFNRIELNQDALNILKEIHEPLTIISVVGSYRRGKSWFANVLHGRHDGFKIGPELEGCTRGIYMWDSPFKVEGVRQLDGKIVQKRVIVLDSEGIDDPKQDHHWATNLFILCLAISSVVIYNINGVIGKDDIGKLCLMTELSSFMEVPEGDFLPRLVILLRDFILKVPESFKAYFLERLKESNQDAANAIERFFCDFDVFGLSFPGCKKSMLQHMENAITDKLDEDFIDEVDDAVKAIYSQLPLKYIGSSTMKGSSFVKFLENIVELMNSSDATFLPIPSEYDAVIQFVAQEAIRDATGRYKNEMNNSMNREGALPVYWEEFDKIHNNCTSEINKLFFETIIGSPTQIGNYAEQLNEDISRAKEEFTERNSKELKKHNEDIANKLWGKHVNVRLTSFESESELQEALKLFESDYRELEKKSPEANYVLVSYKQDRYKDALDHVIQAMELQEKLEEAKRDKEEAERLLSETYKRIEELKRESEEEKVRMAKKALKHECEEYERNFENKMLELQANIKQQKNPYGEKVRIDLVEEGNNVITRYKQKHEGHSNP